MPDRRRSGGQAFELHTLEKVAVTNVHKATSQYEEWLTAYTPLVASDLNYKHQQMTSGVFPFLRATFYRWAQLWPEVCKDLQESPMLLSVGDLHVENFGTWRDAEGRLIWGVNDFDETAHLPYTNDLVRLATSAQLAIETEHLCLECVHACEAILTGYTEGLEAGGKPFVLAEDHAWLRNIARKSLSDPVTFWAKLEKLPLVKGSISESALIAIEHMLPQVGLTYQVRHRLAGLGSLRHPRYLAMTEWAGGRIARKAKALVPSACLWANDDKGAVEIFYQAIMDRAVRSRDPYVQLQGHWIVRRVAPDCTRVELTSLPEEKSEAQLLHAMGWETANIHLGNTIHSAAIKADIKKRKKGWLPAATEAMAKAVKADWKAWKAG